MSINYAFGWPEQPNLPKAGSVERMGAEDLVTMENTFSSFVFPGKQRLKKQVVMRSVVNGNVLIFIDL